MGGESLANGKFDSHHNEPFPVTFAAETVGGTQPGHPQWHAVNFADFWVIRLCVSRLPNGNPPRIVLFCSLYAVLLLHYGLRRWEASPPHQFLLAVRCVVTSFLCSSHVA